MPERGALVDRTNQVKIASSILTDFDITLAVDSNDEQFARGRPTGARGNASESNCDGRRSPRRFGVGRLSIHGPRRDRDRPLRAESAGLRAVVSAYGASLVALEVPDRAGERANVVLGHPSLEAYRIGTTYFGATIGRFANRIANGRFALDGCAYRIPCSDGPNALHGGPRGFDKAVWHVVDQLAAAVRLRHVSADGDQGFPGCVTVDVTYTFEANALRLDYEATTDAPTVVNFTNHSYFNLDGEAAGDVYAHEVQIDAEHYLPIDETSIPRGELRAVAGTPFDFRTPTPIGARIRTADEQIVNGRGYDHTFVLARTQPGQLTRCACVSSPRSGRFLTCETDRPGLQFYTGNMLAGANRGHDGTHLYRQGDGFTLETQGFPDAPNQPTFPSSVLRPGETFRSTTVYRFGTR